MPHRKIAQRIDERHGTYRLNNTPAWLDGARYRPARTGDFMLHLERNRMYTITFHHGGGEFADVGLGFSLEEDARRWIRSAVASMEWHVRTN